jgi:DNA recombination protein RmuC
MDIIFMIAAFAAGILIGLLVMVLTNKGRMDSQRAFLETQYGGKIATLEAERGSQAALAQRLLEEKRELEVRKDADLERLRSANNELNGQVKAVQATILSERAEMEKKQKLLDEAQGRLIEAFKALSAEALQKNNETFLQLAEQNLSKFQEGAKQDLEARQTAIVETIKPVKETLEKFDLKVQELDKKRAEEFGSLNTNITKMEESNVRLQTETNRLVTAL